METTIITKLDINFKNINENIAAVFYRGQLIASSTMKTGCPLSTVDQIEANLKNSLVGTITFEVKKEVESFDSEFESFDIEEMQEELIAFCHDHLAAYGALPVEYEYNNVVFDFEEYELILQARDFQPLRRKIEELFS